MGGASGARVVALPPAASVDAIFRFGSTSASAHVSAVVNGGTTGDYKLISRPDALQDPGAPSGDRKVQNLQEISCGIFPMHFSIDPR